eukprot:6602030-Lingulodinium_polyedra.AAC.1
MPPIPVCKVESFPRLHDLCPAVTKKLFRRNRCGGTAARSPAASRAGRWRGRCGPGPSAPPATA